MFIILLYLLVLEMMWYIQYLNIYSKISIIIRTKYFIKSIDLSVLCKNKISFWDHLFIRRSKIGFRVYVYFKSTYNKINWLYIILLSYSTYQNRCWCLRNLSGPSIVCSVFFEYGKNPKRLFIDGHVDEKKTKCQKTFWVFYEKNMWTQCTFHSHSVCSVTYIYIYILCI